MKTLDQTVQATSGSPAASARSTPSGTGITCSRHGDLLGVTAAGEQRAHLVAQQKPSTSAPTSVITPEHSSPGILARRRQAAGRNPVAAACRPG